MDEKQMVDESIKEQQEALKRNEKVIALLEGSKKKTLTIDVNGVQIRFRASIPAPLRQKLVNLRSKYSAINAETPAVLQDVYDIMAELCVDEPWNNSEVWRLLDEQTGETAMILFEMMQKMFEVTEQVKSFRGGV